MRRSLRSLSLISRKFFRIIHLDHYPHSALPWHDYCSLFRQLTRLASRGGRIRTSTRFRFIGGSVRLRGLAPAPFFISLRFRWLAGAGVLLPASVSSKWFSRRGPASWGPSVFPGRPGYLFSIRGTPDSTLSAILLPLSQIPIAPGKHPTACGSADRCVPPIRRLALTFQL